MKNVIKISLLSLLLLSGINSVRAKECSDIKMYAKTATFDTRIGIHMKYGDRDYNYNYYTLEDDGGAAFSTYCRNAGKSTNKDKGVDEAFVCERKVFNSSDSDNDLKKYESGILAILKNGYSTKASKNYTLSDNREKVATSIALRAYEMSWESQNTNGSCDSTTDMNKAHMTYVNKFLNDSEVSSLLVQAVGKKRAAFDCALTVKDITDNDVSVSAEIEAEAKRLMIIGLKAAIEFGKKGAASVTWSNAKETILETTRKSGTKTFTKIVTYDFDIKSFESAGAYVNLIFDCPTCEAKGVDYNIYLNNENLNKSLNKNLLDYVKDGTGKVTLKIVFKRDAYNTECNSIPYVLDIKYFDETIDTEAFDMRASDCTAGVQCQHFYMLYATDVVTEKNVDSTIEVCDCDELEVLCKNGNNKACKIIEKDYEGKCVNCATEIKNAACTKDDANINIIEGHELDEDTCVRSAETNVLRCIINSKDEAGNSYQSNLINNEYCSVWCKEDYHITLPGQQETTSGRYFTLKASVSGAKRCYTNKMKYDEFINILNTKKDTVNAEYNTDKNSSKYKKALNDYITAINDYNACSGIDVQLYDNKLNQKTTNTGWEMSYSFDPKIKFNYEEVYMNSVHKDILDGVGATNKSNIKQELCLGETDDYYTKCTTGWKNAEDKTANTSQYVCLESGCQNYNIFVSKANYIKQSIDAEGKYITPTQFYTIYPSGAIAVSKNEDIENASPLKDGLPVGLGTRTGVYNYTLQVTNLGEYYSSNKLGRLWGDEDSVVSTLLQSQEPCQTEGGLKYDYDNGKIKDGVYICAYKVNCPDCPVECEEDGCYWKDCPKNNCPVVCENCIFKNDDSNMDYRPISPDDINPNDRDLGKNWASDENADTAMELKAYTTTEEIETYGDTIYDVDYNSDEKYAMEVTLDSKMISKIREYNKNHKKDGYLNNSLKCYDYKNNVDNETYKNVYCYSTFIDELLYDGNLKNNIKITKNRVIGANANETHQKRKVETQSSGYWTTWSEATSSTWKITTERELYFKSKYGTNINIGPSWK